MAVDVWANGHLRFASKQKREEFEKLIEDKRLGIEVGDAGEEYDDFDEEASLIVIDNGGTVDLETLEEAMKNGVFECGSVSVEHCDRSSGEDTDFTLRVESGTLCIDYDYTLRLRKED